MLGRPTPRDDARAARWRDWLRRQHPLAIASCVLGVFSLTHLGTLVVDAVAAIVLGGVAIRRLKAPPPPPHVDGRRLAWVGIVAAALSLVVAVGLYVAGME